MKTQVKDYSYIHGSINTRANMRNKNKLFNMFEPKEGLFFWSYQPDEAPKNSTLYMFKRIGYKTLYN